MFYETINRKYSHNYEKENRYRKILDFIREKNNPNESYSLLDVGCGLGNFLNYISNTFPNIQCFGCDISASAIKKAANKKNIHYKVANFNFARNMYKNNSLNFIIAGEVIEHLENTDNLITECKKYLKEGGYLLITTPNLVAWYERILLMFGLMPFMAEVSLKSRIFGKKIIYDIFRKKESEPVGHLRLFNPSALKELGEYHGLKFIRHMSYYKDNFILNKLISNLSRNFAQGITMIFKKKSQS